MYQTLLKFLEWMQKIQLHEPMRLETDNKDIVDMFLEYIKNNTK